MYFVHFLTIYNVFFRVHEQFQAPISDIPYQTLGKDNTFRNIYVKTIGIKAILGYIMIRM